MQCYQDLTPPTAVTDSVSLPFLSGSSTNLIVAKASLIQVFALKSVLVNESSTTRKSSLANGTGSQRSHVSKLVLISEHEVSGTITALARVKGQRSKSGGELLLVAIKDAKLSLVEWDPERHSISTVSIHYYERDDLQGAPWSPELSDCPIILTVDPGNRCIALKFGPRSLAIIPLKQAGEDFAMEDVDNDTSVLRRTSSRVNGDASDITQPTPYSSSFVLSLLLLDPTLTHPIDLAFLHEYRDPTLGVLFSRQSPSAALLQERKDIVSYTVYTLDLDQQASTSLVTVTGLPHDMHRVTSLPLPVGGALLIGNNSLIHVGQAGKANAVAVNPLAMASSNYPMVDRRDLNLRLEGCVVETLGSSNGELLIITNAGEMVALSFILDGRTVSGLNIKRIEEHAGGDLLPAAASCATSVGNGRLFIGSCDGDSTLIGWTSKNVRSRLTKKESIATTAGLDGVNGEEDDEADVDDEDFEDDLYGENEPKDKSNINQVSIGDILEDIEFRTHDTLVNLAPLKHVTVERSNLSNPVDEDDPHWAKLDLVAVAGRGKRSSLVRMSPSACPQVSKRYDIAGITRLWAVHLEATVDELTVDGEVHNILIASLDPDLSGGGSAAYRLNDGLVEPLQIGDFEAEAGPTIEVGTLFGGVRVVQVLKNEVRAFDGDFSLAQIIPAAEDSEIVAASFADPFVLLIKENGTITVLRANDGAELEELETGQAISGTQWRSGSLHDDVADAFRLIREGIDEEAPTSVLMFLLSEDGGLAIFCLPNLSRPVYTAPGLSFLPPFLTPEFTVRRSNAKDDLIEILVASLGDGLHSSPHLILRSRNEDLAIYSPYHAVRENTSSNALQFRKINNYRVPHAIEDGPDDGNHGRQPMRVLQDLDHLQAVFVPGHSPALILKAASCAPKVIDFKADNIASLTKLNIAGENATVLFTGNYGRLTQATLPTQADFTTGWLVEKIYTTDSIEAFAYHDPSGRYVVGTNKKVGFKLPQDDFHPEWDTETSDFLPLLEVGALELVDPATWRVTDRFTLKEDEVIMSVQKMSLELSENTHARKSVIGVATAGIRGEDINAYGTIYVLDVIDVVPVPDQPETGKKFKTLAHHRDKGAVTAICQVGSEGFVLGAQGQKCMVRGVKDDASLLPVAFMDTQCYISVAKELRGTGLCLLGDAIKGLWLAGYTEDPYHLKMFGKSAHDLEVVMADFLPDGKSLHIVLSDADNNIHVLRFDPQNPKSLSGQHLLHLGSFHSGFYCSTMTLLPRTQTSWERLLSKQRTEDMDVDEDEHTRAAQQILVTSHSGSISLITNLTDGQGILATDSYRTLSALQTYLTSTLSHPLGLSPKAYRNTDVDMSVGGRAILDGNVLRRWMELGSWKRVEGISRIGSEGQWEVKALLEGISGRGLGFF